MLNVYSYRPFYIRIMLVLAGIFCLSFTWAASPVPGGPAAASDWFSVGEASAEGEFITFNYRVRYPGMTKVRLYEEGNSIPVWRGQYVNREEGEYKVRFRLKALDPSKNYRFEFDYKDQIEQRSFPN